MRPPRVQRSGLRYPLDVILGTPAHVRLLRVLVHETAGPLSVTDAARVAGLSSTGARKALEILEESGCVTRVGSGRAQKFAADADGVYYSTLMGLFEVEQREYDELLARLREAVALPEVREAWLRERPADGRDTLEVDVIVGARDFGRIGTELRSQIAEVERRFDLLIEVTVHTRADAPVPDAEDLLLWGVAEGQAAEQAPGLRTNVESQERSLQMARFVAGLLRTDPSLLRRALRYVDMLLSEGQGTATGDITEWRQVLETYSPERIRDLLVASTPRAERLRRSSPFLAVLSPDERERMLDELESGR